MKPSLKAEIASESGMEPNNLLFDKSRRLNVRDDKLNGISPERIFEDKFNELSARKEPILVGITPEMEFSARFTSVRETQEPIESGITPERLFLFKLRLVSFFNLPILSGMLPEIRFELN
jgi:hypothetical protein